MKRASLSVLVLVVATILVLGWWTTRPSERAPWLLKDVVSPTVESNESSQLEAVANANTRSGSAALTGDESTSFTDYDASGHRVLVVDAQTQKPVRDADVRWTFEPQRDADASRPLVRSDPEGEFEASSTGARTNALGLVVLPKGRLPRVVWAKLGDRFGWSVPKPRSVWSSERDDEIEVRVEISSRMRIDIHVVDANGKSVAGVPVSIREKGTVRSWAPIWTGVTGSGGRVRTIALKMEAAGAPTPLVLAAGFEFPTQRDASVSIDPAAPPRDPLVLVLPECGSVTVRMKSAGGPALLPHDLQMHIARPGDEQFVFIWAPHRFQAGHVEAGRASFPFVEIGLDLSVVMEVESKPFRCGGKGPTATGEHVTFEVDVGMQRPQLVGRIVDARGAPIGEAAVGCTITAGSMSMQQVVSTDATGRFELKVPCDAETRVEGSVQFRRDVAVPITPSNALVGLMYDGDPDNRRLTLREPRSEELGIVELDRVLHSGPNDLGLVVMRQRGVLATARFVDESGVDVSGMLVRIEVERLRDGVERWEASEDIRCETSPSGELRICGATSPKRVRVVASAEDYIQLDSGIVDVGTKDARILFGRSAYVSGRLILDDDVDPKRLRVYVRADDEASSIEAPDNPQNTTRAQSDGTFQLRPVRSRLVDLIVFAPGWKEPLVALRDLDLRSGGRVTDARLHAIDLRGRIFGNDR